MKILLWYWHSFGSLIIGSTCASWTDAFKQVARMIARTSHVSLHIYLDHGDMVIVSTLQIMWTSAALPLEDQYLCDSHWNDTKSNFLQLKRNCFLRFSNVTTLYTQSRAAFWAIQKNGGLPFWCYRLFKKIFLWQNLQGVTKHPCGEVLTKFSQSKARRLRF